MTREEIFETMKGNMVKLFSLDPKEITLEADLRDDLGLDSIDAVDMVVELQRMSGRRLSLQSLRSIKTVKDVVELAYAHAHGEGSEADAPDDG